ncbi:hypothetical protein CJ030_MR0G005039 [Morella rubra]|uniref:GRF-type domain-containing protein n=1 Tax=Morella rubra TaxID=262757 RepID=A0A6A1UL51_9ROSI|nr:hypothetical protein CJ030_MR0G005038 [Morella rubra]KAB1201126.1 hypothetical protein CJ030_MR0G005039 [Morella rubra]
MPIRMSSSFSSVLVGEGECQSGLDISGRGCLPPPPLCCCGIPARVKMSLTAANPRHLFYGCSRYSVAQSTNACKFFRWVDRAQSKSGDDILSSIVLKMASMEDEIRDEIRDEISKMKSRTRFAR